MISRSFISVFTLGMAVIGGVGCNTPAEERREAGEASRDVKRVEQEASQDVAEAKRKADEKVRAARERAGEESREADQAGAKSGTVDQRTASVDRELAEFRADLDKAGGKVKEEGQATLKDLEKRRENLNADLTRSSKQETGTLGEQMKKTIDSTLDGLEKDVVAARAKLKAASKS